MKEGDQSGQSLGMNLFEGFNLTIKIQLEINQQLEASAKTKYTVQVCI